MRIRLLSIALLLLASSLACKAVMGALDPDRVSPPALPDATLALPSTPYKTVPSTQPPPSPTASPTPFPPSATPRPTLTPTASPTQRFTPSPGHLHVFEELWRAIDENYLYRDFNGLDWDAVHTEYRGRVEAGLADEEFYQVMDEMVAGLGDEHSVYLSPVAAKDEDAEYAGEYDYVGIGILNTVVAERDRVTIILVFPGSPAEEAGLKIHDSILAVDGQPILDEDGFRRDLLRGPVGITITLTVQTPGEQPRQVEVTRRRINETLPVPHQVLDGPDGKRIGYLLLATFFDVSVEEQVGEALKAMSNEGRLDGIILDNRQNEGGASDVLEGTLAYFAHGTVGHFVNRRSASPLQVEGKDIGGSQKLPLVVLVGPNTISFGEIFAGILKDLGRATLVGEKTDGNVEILYVYEFSDGSRAWLAHDTFRPLNNPLADWEKTGIIPDSTVRSNWDEVTLETDPVIQTALEAFAITAQAPGA